jgi:hypothetical protein
MLAPGAREVDLRGIVPGSETMRITATKSDGWMKRAAFYARIDRSVLVSNLRRLRQIGVSHVI